VRWVQLLLALVGKVKSAPVGSIGSGQWSDRGFSTQYVFKALALAPTKGMPVEEVAPESVRLMEWAEARKQQFAPRASRDAVAQAVGASAAPAAGRSVPRNGGF
jgi:hypothetical protein